MALLHYYNNKLNADDNLKKKARSRSVAAEPTEYSSVGIGKPLCVQIVNIYCGDAPKKLFGGKPDILVVSGVKSPATFNASQRAINQIVKNVESRSYIEPGNAFSKGTPIVYYTPSLEASELSFTFNLVAETFSDRGIKKVEKLFENSAQMPLFIASQTKLIVGTGILSMFRKLGKAVLESKPFLTDTLQMRIDIGGFRDFSPGIKVICPTGKESKLGNEYEVKSVINFNGDENYFLVNKETGKNYDGPIPYVILNVDGKERRDLVSFQPKIASAATVSRFYGTDAQDVGFKVLESGLQLQNDLTFLRKAKALKKEMSSMEEGSDELLKAGELFEAYIKNIQNEELAGTLEIK